MRYTVTYTDTNGTENSRWFDYPDANYAHSSHLLDIMRDLDNDSLDMVSIAVTKDETVEAIMDMLHTSPWDEHEDHHDMNRLYS